MKVYAAEYCSCVHESAFSTISLHQSQETAQAAVDAHRASERERWVESAADDPNHAARFPWTDERGWGFEAWAVREMDVQP